MCETRPEPVRESEGLPDWAARENPETPEGRPSVDVLRLPKPRPAPIHDLQRWLDLCG